MMINVFATSHVCYHRDLVSPSSGIPIVCDSIGRGYWRGCGRYDVSRCPSLPQEVYQLNQTPVSGVF